MTASVFTPQTFSAVRYRVALKLLRFVLPEFRRQLELWLQCRPVQSECQQFGQQYEHQHRLADILLYASPCIRDGGQILTAMPLGKNH